jgi:predicted AAA+ superfamily ATPase
MLFRDKIIQLNDFINNKSGHKNVLVMTGARQVGKSTLIKEALLGKKHLFIDLEESPAFADKIDFCHEFIDFERLLVDSFGFHPTKNILVIDEAQRSRKLGSFVRFMKEKWTQATVILTGSAINELYHGGDERRPVGRETYLDLWPMTFKEFLLAKKQDSLASILTHYRLGEEISEINHQRFFENFEDYLHVGGLPAVVKSRIAGENYRNIRADIFKTYEDDFIRYFSLDDVNLFRRCLETTAHNVGSPSKDSHVVRVDGPGYKKVAGIFARLEKWRLIIKHEQLGTRPEKNKFHAKRYLHDIGVLCDLRLRGLSDVSLNDLSSPALRTPLGGIIENAVALSLAQQFGDNVFGVRLATNSEIDFAVKYDGVVVPIECKMALKFKGVFLGCMPEYLKHVCKNQIGFILYGGPPLIKPLDRIYALPFYLADTLKFLM